MWRPRKPAPPRPHADVSLPFGGVPIGVKELDVVEGWPYAEASLVYADRKATYTATVVRRLIDAGAILAAQTTASEFGGVNYTHTRLHGTTRNPWNTTGLPEVPPGGRPLRSREGSSPWAPPGTAAAPSGSRPASPGCSG